MEIQDNSFVYNYCSEYIAEAIECYKNLGSYKNFELREIETQKLYHNSVYGAPSTIEFVKSYERDGKYTGFVGKKSKASGFWDNNICKETKVGLYKYFKADKWIRVM